MKMTWTLGVAAVAAASLFTGCESNPSVKIGGTQPVAIISQVDANDVAFKDPSEPVVVIATQEDLDHAGSAELAKVKVDFQTQSLVVMTLGEQPSAGYWAHITGVQREGSELYVQGLANKPEGDAAAQMTYPISVAVVPKLEGITHVTGEIDSVTGQKPPTPVEAAVTQPAAK